MATTPAPSSTSTNPATSVVGLLDNLFTNGLRAYVDTNIPQRYVNDPSYNTQYGAAGQPQSARASVTAALTSPAGLLIGGAVVVLVAFMLLRK